MTNKEYFQQAFWIDIQKETLHEEAESLRPFAEKNEKAAVLLERIEAELEAVLRHQAEIREVIAEVRDLTLRLILEKRHLCFESWLRIGREMGHTERWAQLKHRQALVVVQAILDRRAA